MNPVIRLDVAADGRLKYQSFAIGRAPIAGQDKNGITVIMISREIFTKERGKVEALFAAYWAGGGLQANIAVINKGDLERTLH